MKEIKLEPNTKGDRSELMACCWLLKQGYKVFRNVSSAGKADIIFSDSDIQNFVAVDVKSGTEAYRNKKTELMCRELNIKIIVVLPDDEVIWLDDLRKRTGVKPIWLQN